MRLQILFFAAGLLLPVAEQALAAHKASHSQAQISESRRHSVPSPYNAVMPFAPRGTSRYPWGPGRNYPYPDRPYGDPDHD
jgi:hypothetical protein